MKYLQLNVNVEIIFKCSIIKSTNINLQFSFDKFSNEQSRLNDLSYRHKSPLKLYSAFLFSIDNDFP